MTPPSEQRSEKRPRHYGVEHEMAAHREAFIEGDVSVEDFERLIEIPLLRLQDFEDEWTRS
jgi:hypothetical protein